jgi:hypothetical protein
VNFKAKDFTEQLTGLQINQAAAGATGPLSVDFAVTSGQAIAKCVLSTPVIAAAIAAAPTGYYLNALTATFPGGSLRAQLTARGDSAGQLMLLSEPLRAYDSRSVGQTKLSAGVARTIDLAQGTTGAGGTSVAVPPGARAALVILTITQTEGDGFAVLYSNALTTTPATSTINWKAPNQDIATTTTVAVDGTGKVQVKAVQNATHVLIDVIGYYV